LTKPAKKAVFLDRDGTIARDVHYCRRPEDFELLPTVPEAIRLLNRNGFKVVVITNQSGIARGYFTEETLSQIHDKMRVELAEHGAWVDAIYYCPHHPDEGCSCRKPGTALFRKAAGEHDIDLQASYVVGDLQMDIDAGRALGATTVLVTTGPQFPGPSPQSQTPDRQSPVDPPDHVAPDLLHAAKWIVTHS
jgi:histidinol-phosphate phosphatase family protein